MYAIRSYYATMEGLKTYTRFGYTTAQDGGSTPELVAGYIKAAEERKLTIDVVSYVYAQTSYNFV